MKRFYRHAEPQPVEGGWTVALDGKPIRTPAKSPFIAPNEALAAAAAEEWAAQAEKVDPSAMPVTRGVNTAIDRTGPEYEAVLGIVADYGGSDLLCYRAEGPEGLCVRQATGWDPLIGWAEVEFGARLLTTKGVMHMLQPEDGLSRLTAAVAAHDAFEMTALHDLVAMSGSLLIGLAVSRGRLRADEGWALSRIDETWQAELWGVDDEAAAIARRKEGEFAAAARFLDLTRT